MKRYIKYLSITIFSICSISLFANNIGRAVFDYEPTELLEIPATQDTVPDTDTDPRFPVKKSQITNYSDLHQITPIDLRDPGNMRTYVDYDAETGQYVFRTKFGDEELSAPFSLTSDEYKDYTLRQSMHKYFRRKNTQTLGGDKRKDDFALKNIQVNTGNLDRLFGSGGVQLKVNGYAEATLGLKNTKTENPTLSQKNRNRTTFDFDEDIQMNVSASVGEKINFGLNYDTKAAFDFDSKKIKLAYEGDEDEIIKRIEAGNVSMATTNSLINGGSALFGINTELQFGKLRINTIVAQQEAESRTINTQGSVQNTEYEFKADEYDENRHFFLTHYFRENYDEGMSLFPTILSEIKITNIEVWVTNKRGNYDQSRNIVAFASLGEYDEIKDGWIQNPSSSLKIPYNNANNLYSELTTTYRRARDKSQVSAAFAGVMQSGQGYEKLESARLLTSSEYSYNPQLGYLSLNSTLQSDEVLAVAFEYQYRGATYQVGEFAANIVDNYDPNNPKSGALFLKLLKSVSLSPRSYSWNLMMKNVYNLGANNIQKDGFRLQISYQSDTVGTWLNYIPEGKIKNKFLLGVMNLDRLDSRDKPVGKGEKRGDGIFDFVEGLTVKSENGRIYFPVVEPFGSYLEKQINDPAVAKKYVYQELYDSTKTMAQQVAEKNKYKMYGKYRGNVSAGGSSADIDLNATNVPPGSVKLTAAGVTLTEGTHYIVDYMSGMVSIIDPSLLESNTPIQVSLEDRTFSMQRKTMLGLNLSYDISKDFNVGATIMHMYEKPLITKTTIGSESVKNTLWGANLSYRTQSQWLTNMVDKLPFVEATQPSQISFNGEFAQLVAGHYENGQMGGYSYLDDFETSESRIDLKSPYGWTLASTPTLFSESVLSDDINYGKNRAMLSWFMIDGLFTRKGSSLTPQHIRNDKEQLSDHFVREIKVGELYPSRDVSFDDAGVIPALNLSFYPNERGPYNLIADINDDGTLKKPEERWGGITRRMEVRDFEASNVEYIEFWLMDPFVYNDTLPPSEQNKGGDFYINLGDISEDVLKDGKKFYENGLPINDDPEAVDYTNWGKVPKRQSMVYAFDNSAGADGRRKQDVGLNGLSTEEELEYRDYKTYVADYKEKLSPTAPNDLKESPFSPLKDPAGDNYHFYRSTYYDEHKTGILDRYKYFNGTEGNSPTAGDSDEKYSTAARTVPDVEDIDQDNTMNETESYFQYKISLRPGDMKVGKNFITEEREVEVVLPNGKSEPKVTWYQFKVPIRQHDGKPVGTIRDFKSIRFMRMFLTQFEKTTFLRFGSLQLIRGDWRVYENTLNVNNEAVGNGTMDVTRVSIESDSKKEPVNYVLPPGVSRSQDADQVQLLRENEQSLSMKIAKLDAKDARAVYKNTNYDFRRYKRLQLYSHLEEEINGATLDNGDFTVFIRLGSDYKNNYYEYEIPMTVTPPGKYNSNNAAHQYIVWPEENMFDFPLDLLKNVKLNRNKEKRKAGSTISYTTLYSEFDPEKQSNKVSVIGNPSLANVYVIMIGIRNNSRHAKSGEVWVNELRLTDFDDKGGWAAQGNLNIALSDIGTVNFSGRKETVGFGALDQSLLERRSDDYTLKNVAVNMDLGRFIPEKAKTSIPFYYSYSNQTITPEYDPFDTDVKLKESLSIVNTKAEKDSIKSLAQEVVTSKSLSFTNVRVNIQSKTPMPYDPANFSINYSYNENEIKNPTTVYDVSKDYKAGLSYSYSPLVKTWEPFKNNKSTSGSAKFLKSVGFNYVPNNVSLNSVMTRYYTETMTRDIENYYVGGPNNSEEFLSWSQAFYWDRDFGFNWDFTRNLKVSFQSGTRAEIEEPYLQVNKKLNRDHYDRWKDSVWQSIKHWGDPLSYQQLAKITYQLPTRSIPALDWINSSAGYSSNYRWDRGATIEIEEYEVGNTINNNITLESSNRFDLTALYKKSDFLKRVNDRFDSRRSRPANQRQERQRPNTPRKKRFTQEIVLQQDSTFRLSHGLNAKKLDIVAKRGGKNYKLKYKRIDDNTILITNKDTARIKLSIVEKEQSDKSGFWTDAAEYSARGLMSVRSVSINYSTRNETSIAGFKPKIGDMLGQRNSSDYGMVPGVGFAFGLNGGEDYVERALRREWLLTNDYNTTPAIYNQSEKLDLRAQIEPIKGLKIDLIGSREKNDRTEIQYVHGMARQYGGSFSITTIALSSAFDAGNAKNGYQSKAFDQFLTNRNIVRKRLEAKYDNPDMKYPNAGFIASDNPILADKPYNPLNGDVDINSSDVLVPAFLAAYTGNRASKISLSAFPSLLSMLPNWAVTYDGLSNIPLVKKQFKSVRLGHNYTCLYQVGSYNSYTTWVDAGDGLGFIRDVLSGKPTPSSPYNIGAVSIAELFNPLFSLEGVMNNGLTLNTRYNSARTLNLNVSSYQIIESMQKEWVVGVGYRINEFNRIIGLSTTSSKDINNDLNIKVDLSHQTNQALIRKIVENYTQATSGTTVITIRLSADYTMTRALTLRAFYDRIMNEPLITSVGYPTTNSNFGISLRFTLLQ